MAFLRSAAMKINNPPKLLTSDSRIVQKAESSVSLARVADEYKKQTKAQRPKSARRASIESLDSKKEGGKKGETKPKVKLELSADLFNCQVRNTDLGQDFYVESTY